ncbi:MAG: insulinase family protein [Chitinophagaceae bacterium]|nr:insulinase family protein [Chitinophagaceae bacterium]
MYKISSLVCCLFAVLLAANSQTSKTPATTPQLVTQVEGIKEYKLNNGLRILLLPDNSQNNVVVNIVYLVGSRHEGYGESGMAHLLEHMMFKTSKRYKDIKKTIADKGASANGTTWYDRTNYYEVLPANDDNLKWALDMESDRMVNSQILKEELKTEFSVVRNEFESGENDPGGVLEERIIASGYLWHNYGKSTIGSKEDIERVPVDNLRAFYKKYYQPDNAVLMVAGKFDEAKALQWIQQFYSNIPKPTRVLQPTYTVEPVQDGERYVELKRVGDIQYMGMMYHTPSYSDKDYAANQALLHILTNNPSGILYKALVEKKLATGVDQELLALKDPGFTYLQAEIPKEKSADSAKTVFLSTLDKLGATSISSEELVRAKNALIKKTENTTNNTISLCINLTEAIGAGDWRLFFINRDRVEKLTIADVQNFAKTYYKPSNRTWGLFIPDKNPDRVKVTDVGDIDALVKDYKGKEVKKQTETFETSIANIKKNVQYKKLTNGFKYALLKKPAKGEKIIGNFKLRVGNEKSLDNKDMVIAITAQMLRNGTKQLSKKQLNDTLDKIKSQINISGGGQIVMVSINTDKPHFNACMSLLKEVLSNPSFDQNELEKLIAQNKASLDANRNDPQYRASILASQKSELYPKTSIYHTMDADEEFAALNQLKRADLEEFYTSHYGANNGTGALVGDFVPEDADKAIASVFQSWVAKTNFTRIPRQFFDIKGSDETILTPDKANAMALGFINVPLNENDADYAGVTMANELLGGGAFLSSRIPKRLRENEGMSYGAGSFFQGNAIDKASQWGVYAIFNPIYKNRLDSALKQEITKAIDKGFTEEELKKSTDSWLQGRKISLGVDAQLANLLESYQYINRDLGWYTDFEKKVTSLKLSEVNQALVKYIKPEKLVLVYGGDFNKK